MSTQRVKELRKEIRELKRVMKENGIRITSCFNGGHSPTSYAYNSELYRLKLELEREQKNV